MTPAQETEAVLKKICDKHGFTVEDIKKDIRTEDALLCRREIIDSLIKERGMNASAIGRAINRNHASVLNLVGVKKYKDLLYKKTSVAHTAWDLYKKIKQSEFYHDLTVVFPDGRKTLIIIDPHRQSEHAGIKFIKEHQAGKYGGGVRGNVKALMYVQMLECPDSRQVRRLHSTCGDSLYAHEQLHPLEEGEDNWCWVSQEGDIYYCGFGHHSGVAKDIFFTKEAQFETTHAKITMCTVDEEEAMYYVKRPSAIMKRVVRAVFDVRRANEKNDGP